MMSDNFKCEAHKNDQSDPMIGINSIRKFDCCVCFAKLCETENSLVMENKAMRGAIKFHVEQMDNIMAKRPSYERGQQISESLCDLESILSRKAKESRKEG